jgi:hypothetical protein
MDRIAFSLLLMHSGKLIFNCKYFISAGVCPLQLLTARLFYLNSMRTRARDKFMNGKMRFHLLLRDFSASLCVFTCTLGALCALRPVPYDINTFCLHFLFFFLEKVFHFKILFEQLK